MEKSTHISVDDVTIALQQLSTHRYPSVFDEPFLKYISLLHRLFGLKITLYVYARHDDWSLADIPNTYRSELRNAADWLKFGFHAVSEEQKRDVVLPNFEEQYLFVTQQIRRFAGDASIAHILRLHNWFYPKEYMAVLKQYGVKTILGEPDCEKTEIDTIPVWKTRIRIERDRHVIQNICRNSTYPLVIFTHEWILNKKNKLKLAMAVVALKWLGYKFICE